MSSEDEYSSSSAEEIVPRVMPKRSTRGKRFSSMKKVEDDDFYGQEFFKDIDNDEIYSSEDESTDEVDSDFDQTEDDDDDAEVEVKEKKSRRKGVYVDPADKRKRATKRTVRASPKKADADADGEATTTKRSRTKAVVAPSTRSMRKSTRTTSAAASARQKKNAEKSKERASKKTKKVIKILTQEEKLKEAEMTEIYNRQSLQEMLRIEEERGQVKIYQRKTNAITVKYHSTAITTNTTTGGRSKSNSKSSSSLKGSGREGRSFVGFMTELPFENADELKQPYAKKQKCCITGGVAKYRDPQTGKAFSSLEAFKTIRSQ